jgi:hypothetical protein
MAKPAPDSSPRRDSDLDVRDMFDRMTRAYLLTVISDELIEEHRLNPAGHHSEPLSRLLAWCQRRPLQNQYAVKAEADGSYRIVSMTGRRGAPPVYASVGPGAPWRAASAYQ